MHNKKAQITAFVIIGILVIAAVSFALYFYKTRTISGKEGLIDIVPVQNYISSCLKKTSEDAVVYVGQHGGFFELPGGSDERLKLPYYLRNGTLSWTSKNDIELEIANYIDSELRFCLENFRTFRGMSIDYNVSKSNVAINDKNVVVLASFPVKIRKDSAKAEISKFDQIVNSKLGMVLDAVDSYMLIQKNDTGTICVSCLLDIAKQKNLSFTIGNVENSTFVFTITDKELPIEQDRYDFRFLMEYNFTQK